MSNLYWKHNQPLFRKYSDSAIIEGIRRQDDKILNWVYDNYRESVRHHILRNFGTEEDVSDVFQDSIVALYKKIRDNDINLTTDLKGFFFGIAKTVWTCQLRKKIPVQEIITEPIDETPNEDMEGSLLERIVVRAFKKLSDESQKILQLYADGKSFEEITELMDLKNETYARRKKYLSKEELLGNMLGDPEYRNHFLSKK